MIRPWVNAAALVVVVLCLAFSAGAVAGAFAGGFRWMFGG